MSLSNIEINGSVISERRKALGMKSKELAERCNVSPSYISQIEKGYKKNISPAFKTRLYEVLGIHELSTQAELSKYLAKAEMYAQDTTKSSEIINEGESWLENLSSDAKLIPEIRLILVRQYRRSRNFKMALEHAEIGRDCFIQMNDQYGAAKINYEVALLDMDAGNFQLAALRLQRIETEILKNKVFDFFLTSVYLSLAICGTCLEDNLLLSRYTPLAEEHLSLVPETKVGWYQAVNDYLVAENLFQNKNFITAAQKYEMAAMKYQAENDIASSIRMKHNVAEAYFKAGDLQKAKSISEYILQVKRDNEIGDNSIAKTILLLSKIAFAEKELLNAQQLSQQIFNNDTVTDLTVIAEAFKIFANCRLNLDDPEGYTKHLEEAIIQLGKINDSGNLKLQSIKNALVSEYLTKHPLKGLTA